MGVLLPWDRKKAAKQEGERRPDPAVGIGVALPIMAAVVLFCVAYLAFTSIVGPTETIWEVPGGRLLSQREGLWVVDTGEGVAVCDSEGISPEVAVPDGSERLLLGDSGPIRFAPLSASERVVAVLDDDTVLTQKPSEEGRFGEPWLISAYRPPGNLKWITSIPGVAAAACRRGTGLVIAITDLSAGAMPSLALLNPLSGDLIWVRALSSGAWRAVGALEDKAWVAVLSSGVTVFDNSGGLRWSFAPAEPIVAAVVMDSLTCVSFRANRGLQTLVYPYEINALSSDGEVRWSCRVRQEPVGLQPWMGKEALAAITENHVLGFNIEDGVRLFAERTGAGPVSLAGDKLLIRDNRGVRLVRLQSIDLSAP